MKRLIISVFAICTMLADAKTLNVADYGIVPGKDAAYRLHKLILSVRHEPDVTLHFPKGHYDFHPEQAFEQYRAVANHDNGLKRMVFPLFGHKNITIDGNGSLFLFHGHVIPFALENVQGATLKDFSIDWKYAFHAELEVTERDIERNSVTVKIDPELYPYRIQHGELLFKRYEMENAIGANIVFDPRTRSPIYHTRFYELNTWNPTKAINAGTNLVKLEGTFLKEPPPVGSVIISFGVDPTSRLCPAIHIVNSKDINIENVTIRGAGGMGLIVERTENIFLNGMTVTSTEERLVSTRADATHFIGCKGTVRLENCLFEHMLDDGINVHGAYVKVEDYLGNNEFICSISHFQQWGLVFAEPGDKIALLSRKTVLPFFETTVTGIKQLNEKCFVLTVAEVPQAMPNAPMSVENLSWHPDLVMKNNIIRENRARSVLVTTKGKVLIENNYFSSQMHGILIEGDNNEWYESGAVRDITILSNIFENIGYEVTERYPLLASPLFTEEQHTGEGQYHRNINFVGNTIKSFNGLLANARSVKGLNISGNTVEFGKDYPEVDEGPSIVLEYCADVVLEDNKVKGFDRPAIISQSTDSTEVVIGKNDGFKAGQHKPHVQK